jgi:hypothetical protein
VAQEREALHKAQDTQVFALTLVVVRNMLLVIERGEHLEDGVGLVGNGNAAEVLQNDHDMLDIGAKETCAGLVGFSDELEGEKHGSVEGVEGAPVEDPGNGEAAVREEVGASLGDELGEAVGGADGSFERLLPAGIVDVVAW